MLTSKKINFIFIIFLSAFSISFFEVNFINYAFLLYSQYILFALVLFLSIPHLFISKKGFVFPIHLILISIIISIIFAYITWNQGFILSLKSTIQYTIFILFFYLLKSRIGLYKIEKMVLGFGIIYSIFLRVFSLLIVMRWRMN
jgi:hypothetical protein